MVWESGTNDNLTIIPEKKSYKVGETAKFLVQNPYPGARALFTTERYGVQRSWVQTLTESSHVIEVPVTKDNIPGFYFSGVVMSPRRSSVFRHIEFLRLSDRRVLVIMVSPDGDVQNRVIFTDTDIAPSQLVEAANYLNTHFVGMAIDDVRQRLQLEVEKLQTEIAALMQAAVQFSSEAIHSSEDEVVISGERNLLSVSDFSSDMGQLRRAFDLFEQKAQLIRLLDMSHQAEGVRIYIGGESQVVPFEELSVVSANYEVDGQVVGTLGVIGPTRMPYDRMIQIVDITAKLVSNALSHK